MKCSICLDELNKDTNYCITSCNHEFHFDCLLKWKNDCPICRNGFVSSEYLEDDDINSYGNEEDNINLCESEEDNIDSYESEENNINLYKDTNFHQNYRSNISTASSCMIMFIFFIAVHKIIDYCKK